MKQHKDLLRKILGDIPRYTRCREGHYPFTQTGEDLFPVHRLILRCSGRPARESDAAQRALIPLPVHLPIFHPIGFPHLLNDPGKH